MQTAARVDVADEGRRLAAVGAALDRAHRLRDGEIHHAFALVVARESERIVRLFRETRGCRLRRRLSGLELLEDVVEQSLVERKLGAQVLGADVGRDLGDDADHDGFVLQIDRERKLL